MIRSLNRSDTQIFEAVHGIFQRSYQVEANLLGINDFPPLRRTVDDLQGRPSAFYGFWIKEQLAGVIEIQKHADLVEICSLVVDPVFFRMGIGSALLDFVNDQFLTDQMVETGEANIPAITLYVKHGFKITKYFLNNEGIQKVRLLKRVL